MEWWDTVKGRARAEEEVLKTVRYDLERMREVALAQPDHLVTSSIISGALDLRNKSRIIEVLEVGVAKGLFELVANTGEKGFLTDEQYKRFKHPRGYTPRVYRATEKK